MIDLARRLRPYGLLAAAVVLVVAAVRYVDLDTVEWILRGAPSVKAETPSGSITVQGTDFSLDSFRQLLSRDGITPIYDPKFVSAAKASFGDNDLVMGGHHQRGEQGLPGGDAELQRDGHRRSGRGAHPGHLVTHLLHRSGSRPAARRRDPHLWQPGRSIYERHDLV